MSDKQNEIYSGIVKMYNGKFGFIEYYNGDIFFHKADLESNTQIEKGNEVSFKIISSKKKKDEFQASKIILTNSNRTTEEFEIFNKLKLGKILWHDYRGYGVIEYQNTEYFFRDDNINNKKYSNCYEGRKCIFKPYSKSYNHKAFDVFTISDSLFETLKSVIFEKTSFVETIKNEILSYSNVNGTSTFGEIIQLFDLLTYLKIDKSEITETIYCRSNSDMKFLFWYNSYSLNIELKYIAEIICDRYGQKLITLGIRKASFFDTEPFEPYRKIIISKILSQEKHEIVLNQLLQEFNTITSYWGEYDIIKLITELDSVSQEDKDFFYKSAYLKCDNSCKFRMWETGLVKDKDINLIAENLPYTIPEFIKIFDNSTNDEKFILLGKAIEKYHYKREELNSQELVNTFVTSEFFTKKIANSKLSENFYLSWYYNQKIINAQNIVNSFNPEDFIKFVQSFKEKGNLVTKIGQFYSELPMIFQLQLWLSDIFGELDYIRFTQVFHQLENEDKKLFNKKVKSLALEKQINSFLAQVPNAITVERKFDFIRYKCRWRNIYFKNQSIQIFINSTESTNDYPCIFSRKELNLLTQEYFKNKRIDDIIIDVDKTNSIKQITGLESIETQVIFAEVRKNVEVGSRHYVSNEEVIRLIHNVAERNKCIQFLNKQNSPFNVVDIQELVTEIYGGLQKDISFLYSIPDTKGNVYLIWESVEFEKSKATHIFKCDFNEVDDYIDLIKSFLETTVHSRSTLNSSEKEDAEIKNKLSYFGKINHDSKDYSVWEARIKNVLPFLN
jgi:cold shock CspA family protein